MATLGVMNKNQGQDTRVYGLHDHLFRRRVDLDREEGNKEFNYPLGRGDGTRNALLWTDEISDLPFQGRKHFPRYTRHSKLGYQQSSRNNTPLQPHRVSHRYDHLKKSSVFPFDDVKQKSVPSDKRNGIPEVSPGDKSYRTPDKSPGFFVKPQKTEEVPLLSRSITSAPPALNNSHVFDKSKWHSRHTLQDAQDVRDIETWKPAPALTTVID